MLRHAWRSRSWLVTGAMLCTLIGCINKEESLQNEDGPEPVDYQVQTIGDITAIGNAQPLQLGGVGLVENLNGTGGPAPKDGYRTLLEEHLRKQGVKNVKALMNSPNHSLVIVSASIPPGAHKGQRFNIEVRVPPQSATTSLRGGRLRTCSLFYYNTTTKINPSYDGPASILRGHDVARAGGEIQVDLAEDGEGSGPTKGIIYDGGFSLVTTPFAITMNSTHQFASFADLVARRINTTFAGRVGVSPDAPLATARNNTVVTLNVPRPYRLNMPRFLRVVRLIPLRETYNVQDATGKNYQGKLADDLLDPSRTVTAILRLEALGKDSISMMKSALQSDNPLVRFSAAEGLAYLGSPAGGRELAGCIETQPKLRALALTALASLDENVSVTELRELVQTSDDDEVRYGAFRALRTLNDKDPAIRGELLNNAYWVHRVRCQAEPMVHLASKDRPEIVLFGRGTELRPPFSIRAGDFTITGDAGDDHCMISYFPGKSTNPVRRPCPLALDKILEEMSKLNATYPDVVEMFEQARACKGLTCQVKVDALPMQVEPKELVQAAVQGGQGLREFGIQEYTVADVQRVRTERRLASRQSLSQEELRLRAQAMLRDIPGEEKPDNTQRAEAEMPR